jgi:hypothetical protein
MFGEFILPQSRCILYSESSAGANNVKKDLKNAINSIENAKKHFANL